MENADGTRGPHFTLEKAKEIMKQYNVDCDPLEFYVVLNSLYSDYDQALKKNNASNLELYACLAKAWIEDKDAVPNKAAAYYTYVVKH
jgi:3-deoxy-D-arabino-heptulosonate 7-phosphate (DAHP) synthase class II